MERTISNIQNEGKIKIAVDMDEVLVDIVPKWISLILEESVTHSFLDLNHPETLNEILSVHPSNRTEYDIMPFLVGGKDKVQGIPEPIKSLMYDLYFENKTFYEGLNPTPYCNILLNLLESRIVNQVLVITKCGKTLQHAVTKSKLRWLNEVFQKYTCNNKVTFCLIEGNEKKSDAIKKNNFDYTTFVDDSLENILDVIKHTNSDNKEFLIPRMTYNSLLSHSDLADEFYALSELKKCQTYWFDNSLRMSEKDKLWKFVSLNKEDVPEIARFNLDW